MTKKIVVDINFRYILESEKALTDLINQINQSEPRMAHQIIETIQTQKQTKYQATVGGFVATRVVKITNMEII